MRKLDLNHPDQSTGTIDLAKIMDQIKIYRKLEGLSQAQFAEMAGVSQSTVSKYERGLFPTRVVWLAAMARAAEKRLTVERD